MELAPTSIVVLGAAGDLNRRKLLPALYNLWLDGLLPEKYSIVGFARREMDDESFREVAEKSIEQYGRRGIDRQRWDAFLENIHYVKGSFDEPEAFAALGVRLEALEKARAMPANRIFYLSIPPSAIEMCVDGLAGAGLIAPPVSEGPTTRIIIEKPIGHDLESARVINDKVATVFAEEQIFRIDHYLGKETVQSILVTRFGNAIFEPLWNQKYIDHVQITVAEEEGVGTRAGYYEEAGALRDMVQNHILQVLCLTAMEPPWAMAAEVVRDHKMEVLNCLRPIGVAEVGKQVVRAQYGAGSPGGQDVPGYRREDRVAPDSTTETYVAIEAHIDNWRWSGVPFYLRTGKRLPARASEIAIQFKAVPPVLFNAGGADLEPNVLAMRIQPDEGMSLTIATKSPGLRVAISPVRLNFQYESSFDEQSPEAYERLLLDVVVGDATLFMRRDAVEASWAWISGILEGWEASGQRWLPEYSAGSWGPVEADRMISGYQRRWRKL
ncbi:MAG: glucose-6-phosphate dehydrogenase [Deltaproteobacteria bacterium]